MSVGNARAAKYAQKYEVLSMYVGSYARDALLRLSKAVKQLWTMAAASAGRKRRPWSATIIGPHVTCLRGSWGTLSAKGSIAGGYFATQ